MKTTFSSIVLLFATLSVAIANPTVTSSASTNPTDVYTEIRKQVETKYKDAVILDIESEDGRIEVEIRHNQKEKEVIFSITGVWQSTKYDILKSQLPDKIKTVIENSKYSSYGIDDIEVIETPKQSLYEIELEKLFKDDITIYITFEGKIL